MKHTELRSLGKSFTYAFRGVAYCVKNERNMRIHLAATVLVSYFSYFYGLSRGEYLVLLLCCGFVIAAEAFNTAIEALVNLESPAYHHYARIAKDVAAGAVFVAALTAAIAGAVLFFQPERLWKTLLVIFQSPLTGAVFLILVGLGLLFIFNGSRLTSDRPPRDDEPLNNFDSKH